MQLHVRHRNARLITSHGKPRRTIDNNHGREPSFCRESAPLVGACRASAATAEAAIDFGCFRVLLRRRQLFADGVAVALGTRAFDLLLALLDGDGALVTKNELMSRAWPGIVVSEENLKVQICTLRKALGEDGDIIRTDFGRGYRLTAVTRRTGAPHASHCRARVA